MLTAGAIVLTAFADRQLALTKASLRFGNFANDRGIDTPAYLRAYTHDRVLIGKALAPCVRPDDYAIFGGVGALPYYARLRGIDVFGLVSSRVAHEVRAPTRAPATTSGARRADARAPPDDRAVLLRPAARGRRGAAQPLRGFWLANGFEKVVLHVRGWSSAAST
jgi:hypothetical protein